MKTRLVIAGILAFNLVVLWCLAHHYEFHTGMDGRVVWRCNNFTGKVEYSSIGDAKWVAISYPKPNPTWENTTPLPENGEPTNKSAAKGDIFDQVAQEMTNKPTR